MVKPTLQSQSCPASVAAGVILVSCLDIAVVSLVYLLPVKMRFDRSRKVSNHHGEGWSLIVLR